MTCVCGQDGFIAQPVEFVYALFGMRDAFQLAGQTDFRHKGRVGGEGLFCTDEATLIMTARSLADSVRRILPVVRTMTFLSPRMPARSSKQKEGC